MNKLNSFELKIARPIILSGLFAVVVFAALQEKISWGFYLVSFLFLIYVFFYGIAVGQNLSSPIKKLLDQATELSKGNFFGRVYLETTKDELAELAKVFNKIAEEMEAMQNMEKTINVKVQAKTKELEEVINALEQKVKNRTIELERLIEETNNLKTTVRKKEAEVTTLKEELEQLREKVNKYKKRLAEKSGQ